MGLNDRVFGVAMVCRRSGCRLGFLLIFLLDLLGSAATNMEPIYWNSLNKRFLDDKGYILYPQIGDRLDLICPSSEPPGPRAPAEYEYYKLYLVSSREQADRCEVTGAPNLLLTCDKPTSDMRFTIKFQEYSPNLWGHEFKTNADYYIIDPYGLPPKPAKPDQSAGRTNTRTTGGSGNATHPRVPSGGGDSGGAGGENGPLPPSNVAVIAGAAGGSAFLLLVTAVICVVCYRRRHAKHSESHHPPLSLSSLTSPKRHGGGHGSGNNNGSEPSDIIIPLRTSDSAYCPHYEKVSGDYGHPVYIVQEMPPQSPANIYYKV
ncbi:ephrin-B3b isoform X2 [Esox lucius]|uniref:Ephrin RBD domain-containing protein n=1 Tax=Esox lucius TaxID=8010 RepID=A0A3P8Z9J8_ESOLU|nr:ephrin-B3b isoform X2 [Esox lucius]